jgi:hypothetical protein
MQTQSDQRYLAAVAVAFAIARGRRAMLTQSVGGTQAVKVEEKKTEK